MGSQPYAHNRGGHQVGHGARKHGPNAQAGQFAALIWRQRAYAADLYPDADCLRVRSLSELVETLDPRRAAI